MGKILVSKLRDTGKIKKKVFSKIFQEGRYYEFYDDYENFRTTLKIYMDWMTIAKLLEEFKKTEGYYDIDKWIYFLEENGILVERLEYEHYFEF